MRLLEECYDWACSFGRLFILYNSYVPYAPEYELLRTKAFTGPHKSRHLDLVVICGLETLQGIIQGTIHDISARRMRRMINHDRYK
jgi:hypothetical protein